MTREAFEAGEIYIFVGAYTKRCFRVREGVLESHYKVIGGFGDRVWERASGWGLDTFYIEDAFQRFDASYITPDDYFLECLGKTGQL